MLRLRSTQAGNLGRKQHFMCCLHQSTYYTCIIYNTCVRGAQWARNVHCTHWHTVLSTLVLIAFIAWFLQSCCGCCCCCRCCRIILTQLNIPQSRISQHQQQQHPIHILSCCSAFGSHRCLKYIKLLLFSTTFFLSRLFILIFTSTSSSSNVLSKSPNKVTRGISDCVCKTLFTFYVCLCHRRVSIFSSLYFEPLVRKKNVNHTQEVTFLAKFVPPLALDDGSR